MPPYYPVLRGALEPAYNSHLARLTPLPVHTAALFGRQRSSEFNPGLAPPMFETPVAATVVLCDPRRRDGTAYLAWLHCVNDADSLERLLEYLAGFLPAKGYRKVIGPTGLSPHLGSGLLQDYWDRLPPLHTPYNPPYLPEVAHSVLHPLGHSRLYYLEIPPELPAPPPAPAELLPLDPARLATELRPLLVEACLSWVDFAPPDAKEAAFLLSWLGHWPLHGWLAQRNEQPVGFILLQPDLVSRLRRGRGGRNPLWRLWLAWASRQPVRQGRVLFAAVLPPWQGQGIGRQLLYQAIYTAHQHGWRSLSIGPLPGTAPAGKFLEHHGGQPRQTYLLYQQDL